MMAFYKKHKEIVHYFIVGGLTTLISLVVYYALVYTVLDPANSLQLQLANIISWILSVLFAYITNRIFVFESKNEKKVKEAGQFFLSRVATLLLDMGIMFVFVTLLHGNDKVFKLVSQVVVIVLNYILSKIFVFKK